MIKIASGEAKAVNLNCMFMKTEAVILILSFVMKEI